MLFNPKWERGEPERFPFRVGDLVMPSDKYLWRGKGPGLVTCIISEAWPVISVKWHNLKHSQDLHIRFVVAEREWRQWPAAKQK